MTVAGLLLAAGAGRRFGTPKALVMFDGEPLVVRGQRLLCTGGCDPVLAVLGARADDVIRDAGGLAHVVAVEWESGMGASLRAGLAALRERPFDAKVDAAVVALVDQPLVGAEAIRRLIGAYHAGAVAAVATYAGRPRNPVLLTRGIWADVADSAQGDVGARPWLRAHPDLVVQVPCDDTGQPDDADTPEELQRLLGRPPEPPEPPANSTNSVGKLN